MLDYQSKVWVSTRNRLLVLDAEMKLVKEFKVPKSEAYSELSQPDQKAQNLLISYDRMKMLWFKSNYEIVRIHCKSLEILGICKNILKIGKKNQNFQILKFLADIERMINFSHTMNCKEVIYFTNKRMIGEMMYFLDFRRGLLKKAGTSTTPTVTSPL